MHPAENEQRVAFGETAYLLQRWEVSISDQARVTVRPLAAIGSEELAGLIMLLKRCCDDWFPRSIRFDFSRTVVRDPQWCVFLALVRELARDLGARIRLIGGSGTCPFRAAVVQRKRRRRDRADTDGLGRRA